jgi:hypothetical protein
MVDSFMVPLVPVTKPDFSCSDSLFGGELTLKKAKLDPAGEFVKYVPTEPSLANPTTR